jgi:hypothetical protein
MASQHESDIKRLYQLSDNQVGFLKGLVIDEMQATEQDIQDAKVEAGVLWRGSKKTELESLAGANERRLDFLRRLYKDLGGKD